MWIYEKKLEYPARVSGTNPRLAKDIITQYGGPDGELAASLRYLTAALHYAYIPGERQF